MELEEELKATREDYEEEIEVLVDKNADLTMRSRYLWEALHQ